MIDHNFWHSASIYSALEGKSIIDSDRLSFDGIDSVGNFIDCYGYNWADKNDREEIERLRVEAIALIEEELLHCGEFIPSSIIQQTDIRALMLALSQSDNNQLKQWICALMRVMHTLAHSYSYLNDRYRNEIREQIMARFSPYIHHTTQGMLFDEVPIFGFESRPAKSRRSVAMKLLHKSENVAADIFDWIGLRFITHHKIDVLRILSILRQKNVIMFANIKPSRSRNTLLDLALIESETKKGTSFESLKQLLDELPFPTEQTTASSNPFSESTYHSVQFTSRQRIKILSSAQQQMCFFFPYEIQLIDHQSYVKARTGMASHDEYKRRQRKIIRRRILPHLAQ